MTLKVVALCGSPRSGSYTRMALDVAVEAATKVGAEVTMVDLAEWRLPLYEGDMASPSTDATVQRFKATVSEAQGLLVATPVYHDSFSGVLKNAIDHLYQELANKVVGLIAVAGGRAGHGLALEHLRTVFRETNTWVLPRQVPVGMSKEAFDEERKPKDPETALRLNALGQELVVRTKVLRPVRPATPGPGGR